MGISGSPDENGFYVCGLTIEPSSFGEKLQAHWKHPSLAYRLPYRLAVLSVILGAIGLILGVVSILK